MTESPLVSFIVPALNEERRIGITIEKTAAYLRDRGLDAELILCDDGSTDRTVSVVREHMAKYPWLSVVAGAENRGKGYAIRQGVKAARGRYVGYMDADYKTPIEEFDLFLPKLELGIDCVIGSREKTGATIEVAQPWYRRVGSRTFAFLLHQLVGLEDIPDTQCGFKFFQRRVIADIFARQRIDGYMFDVEILCLAKMLGCSIDQVPIRWHNDPDSRLRLISGNIRNARDLFRIRAALGAPSRRPSLLARPEVERV